MLLKPMKRRLQDIILYILAGSFLGYVVLRAVKIGFTHDESFTWHYYIKGSFLNIFHNNPPNANNHMLLSLLAKIFSGIFGYNQFVLRLPAVLAYVLYLWVAIRFCKRFKNQLLVVSGFVLLNANPYLLDFFALSRGYALAHAFMFLGIYLTLRFVETGRTKYVWYAMTAASLAVLSISTMIYFFAATVAIINIYFLSGLRILRDKPGFTAWLRMNIPVFTVTAITTGLIFEHARKLIVYKQLYFGGSSGFYDNTIISLMLGSFYNKQYFSGQLSIVAWVLIAVAVFGWLYVLRSYLKYKKQDWNLLTVLGFLFLIILFSAIHHHLLDGAYLVSRTSLFFYPLIMCVLIILLNSLGTWLKGWITNSLGVLFGGMVIFHLLMTMNLSYTSEWKYDACTRQMLDDVGADLRPAKNQEAIKIGINWTFEPSINYYRETQQLTWLKEADQNGFDTPAAYYYVYEADTAYLFKNNFTILQRYKLSGTILAKGKNR
jgi:hypothetical protein